MRDWETGETQFADGFDPVPRAETSPPLPHDTIEVSCRVVHRTAEAVLVNDAFQDIWLPSKLVTMGPADPISDWVTIKIPAWLASEKGLM